MITQFMPSAKQIKARKAFVKKYAKKGKRKKKTKSDSMSAKTKRASGYTLDEWEKRKEKLRYR